MGALFRLPFPFLGRLIKSLSSLLDVMTMFRVDAAFPLAGPLACMYQYMHVLDVYEDVVWTTLNYWDSGITIGGGLAMSFALSSYSLLVALLVCN
jgi:hypothetical protein